jgi:branched-chain amino acid transport system ATP-binding protein
MLKAPPPPSADPSIASAPILEAVRVSQRFGGVLAVDAVTLAVHAGEIVGLIGPNGAGKTTLFDVLAGERAPSSGAVRLRGRSVEHRAAETRLADGVGRTFQIARPFGALSLMENMLVGAVHHPGETLRASLFSSRRSGEAESRATRRAMEWLEFVGLSALAAQPASCLSGGQRKLLDLARLLMAEPVILLLDEPTAGVHPSLVDALAERLQSLAKGGMAVLLIEHQLSLIAELCNRVVVMAQGRVLTEGSATAVLADPRVAEAYLGGMTT